MWPNVYEVFLNSRKNIRAAAIAKRPFREATHSTKEKHTNAVGT